MPNPDGVIETRALAGRSIESNLLAKELETEHFTATTRFTGPYETSVSATDTRRIYLEDGRMFLSSGDADEVAVAAFLATLSGSGDSRTLQVGIFGPSFFDNEGSLVFTSRSASFDDSTTPPGWVFSYGGGSTQNGLVLLQNNIGLTVLTGGTATFAGELVIPAVTSDPSSPADGNMWLHTVDNALYIWEGGAKRTVASW